MLPISPRAYSVLRQKATVRPTPIHLLLLTIIPMAAPSAPKRPKYRTVDSYVALKKGPRIVHARAVGD